MAPVAKVLAGIVILAEGASLRRTAQKGAPLPFDCYVEKGEKYEVLKDTVASGRRCKNWLEVEGEPYGPTTLGIGNHHYCRNPTASKDKPWCYTVDPAVEWEYCAVSECKASATDPEPFVAPEGAKSADAEAAGPCEPPANDHPGFEVKEAGRSCMANRGDTWWLIGHKLHTVADAAECSSTCKTVPGTELFTLFGAPGEDGNCGCYRECILTADDLTVHDPTVYKLV